MAEAGTGYIIQVIIQSQKGIAMRDLDFKVELFTQRYNRPVYSKKDMICITGDDENQYFTLFDSALTGPGMLFARVTINDPMREWSGGKRPVIIEQYTGKNIGTGGTRFAPSRMTHDTGWQEGYKLSFVFHYALPKPAVGYIFYGNIVDKIMLFSDLTADMLFNPENHIVNISAQSMGKTSVGVMEEGRRVVVLIPTDTSYTATKDNGIGGKVPFNESILGANGDVTVNVDGTEYRVYGELMTTEGEMFVYVD